MTAAVATLFAIAVAEPQVAGAEASVTFVSWTPGVASAPVAIGSETDITFAPGERITYASLEDGARWDARELTPVSSPDGTPIPRIAVRTFDHSDTILTVTTTGRSYRLRLRATTAAPAEVAYVYSRVIIDHRRPAPPLGTSSAPLALAAVSSATPPPSLSAPIIPVAGMVAIPTPLPTLIPAPVDPCAGKNKGATTSRIVLWTTQLVNALIVTSAERSFAFTHAIFGQHALGYNLGVFATEDYIQERATARACAQTANEVRGALTAAAAVNAIGTQTHP